MTTAAEEIVMTEEESATAEGTESTPRSHDFTKFREFHQELADYINAHSGLDDVSPNQVKAVLTLRTDFSTTPEQIAKREERKERREAEKRKYEGMTDEQIKASKAAARAQAQVAKLEAKAQEARQNAEKLIAAASGSGEDLAAIVEAQQGDESPARSRRLGRSRSS